MNGNAYYVEPGEQYGERKADAMYLPHMTMTDDGQIVIVKIQNKFSHLFITHIHYGLNLFKNTKVLLIFVLFDMNRIFGKQFLEKE